MPWRYIVVAALLVDLLGGGTTARALRNDRIASKSLSRQASIGILKPQFLPLLQGSVSGPVNYVYDELGRLIAAIDASGNAAVYSYDAVGNILSIQRFSSSQTSVIAFSPDHGPEGATVTITGTGFSSTPTGNTVSFNGVTAVVTSATSTAITATVPVSATTGPITVTSPAGTATSVKAFTITTASSSTTITGFSPRIGTAGSAVTITGTNFSPSPGNNRIRFNNSAEATISTATNTTLATTVPSGTGSGRLSVATPNGATVSTDDFFVPLTGFAASSVAATGRINIGSTQGITLAAGQLAIFVFDANLGQRVSVQTSNSSLTNATLYLLGVNGATLTSTTFGASNVSLNSSALPVQGTYAIGVSSGSGSGSVSVQVNDATDVTGTIAIDGPPVTVTTTRSGQDVWLKFNVIANQQFVLEVTNVTNPSARINFYGPTGELLTGSGISSSPPGQLFFVDQQTFPVTGSYSIQVAHSGTGVGSETLQLISAPDFVTPITIGGSSIRVPTVGNTKVGQNGRLTFTAITGQKVSANITNATYPPSPGCSSQFRDDEDTALPTGQSSCISGSSWFMDTTTISATGTYHVFINPGQMATGNATVQLYDATDVTGTISIDGSPVTATTTVMGQDARLTFSATAGQRIALRVTGVTSTFAGVALLRPDGTQQNLIRVSNNPPGQTSFMDTQTLGTTGTYTIWLQHTTTSTGSATFQLNSVPLDYSTSLTLGTPAQVPGSGNLSIGQNANLSFNGTVGYDASIQFSSNTLASVNVTLRKPDGTTLTTLTSASGTSFGLPMVMLPTTGVYTIAVDPVGPASGSLSVLVTLLGGPAPVPTRMLGASINPSSSLSQNLVGLFMMNEGSGTTDTNIVDGQTATFSGTTLPLWNTTDPSIVLRGTTSSLSSYLDAGTDLNFDQLTPNKMTVVAKVFLNAVAQCGIAEKTDDSTSGFTFALDNTGALTLYVLKSAGGMQATTAANAIISGQWVQVAFTWDGTLNTAAAAHIYIDGVEQPKVLSSDGAGIPNYVGATTRSFRIGNNSYFSGGSLNGKIAYLAVYKYRVLTPTELNQLDTQLPITTDVVGTTTEDGATKTVTTTAVGQNAHVSFQGWANQSVTVGLSNNSMGQVTVNLVAPDGSTQSSAVSSSTVFALPQSTLPSTGTYDVFVQGPATTGGITVGVTTNAGGRPSGSAIDSSNALSTNLVGLFLMNENTGTVDTNLVDAQAANFSSGLTPATPPVWVNTDPSMLFKGTTTSLSSYLDAGADLTFDQFPTSKVTVVAKVFLNSATVGGIAEKTDDSTSGFIFGLDNTSALNLYVLKSAAPMRVATGAGTLKGGQWVQIAFTWDGTIGTASAAHLYVNGVEQTKALTQDGSGTLSYTGATSKSFRIGNNSYTSTTNGALNGKVAYLAVYRGRILSTIELNQLDTQLPIH